MISFILNQSVKILTLLFLVALALLGTACENDIGPLIIEPENPSTVSFKEDIQPIFNTSCNSCHDEFHQYLDLRACCAYDQLLNSGTGAPYINIEDPGASKLYRHLTGDLLIMPLFGPLPDHEINLVLRWISEGALDN